MKKPRLEDFDPNTKVPELATPLDGMPPIQRPALNKAISLPRGQKPPVAPTDKSPEAGLPYGSTSARPYARTPVRRTITRYAFEFFQDQIENLRRFSLEEKARGERGSMSQMIREAADAYIAKRNRVER